MNTGDASYIKQLNRKILLEEIIKNNSLSRSDLARITGLNKATVSSQVNTFIKEQLVIENNNESESISRGRKPILLEINRKSGYSIGIDIDDHHITALFMNVKGEVLYKHKAPIQYEHLHQLNAQLIEYLTPMIETFNQEFTPYGLIGITIGIHGIVNNEEEIIFTPKQEWSNINIKDKLEDALNTKVYIDNNANLSVFAEQVFDEHISNLFCITLYSGIGLGIISENKIYRGYQGFAGEIGHMIVQANGKECPCGNRGCWELYASERTLSKQLKDKYPSLPIKEALESVYKNEELEENILEQYLNYLATGLNNVINIFNPEKIILNGEIINGNLPLISPIEQRLKSKMNNYREIRTSNLGEYSCVLGGAALAVKNFFGIDMIDYTKNHTSLTIKP